MNLGVRVISAASNQQIAYQLDIQYDFTLHILESIVVFPSGRIDMSNWPKQSPAAMNAFYGNPDANGDFHPDPVWEAANIVKIVPPYQLYYPEKIDGKIHKRHKQFSSLRVHRKCSDSLARVLSGINASFSAQEIAHYELDLCAGVHVFRLKTEGKTLSIHSWGAAIDLSHLINRWKAKHDDTPKKKMMPKKVVDLFEAEGWTWGGEWKPADGMHFQAADL